jgi:colanic acid biosynthesis glycosyl transferase WcaI
MRVLILSQYYSPEPVPKPAEMADALRRRGHQVSVLTGYPSYPSGDLYAGYRLRLAERTNIDGVPVVRCFEYPAHGTRALGRIANYLSFMISAPFASVLAPGCDVIYVWHPPLTVGIAAAVIARLRGVRFVYDVQDIWPESALLSGMLQPGLIVRFLSRLERVVYRLADHILVVTEGARQNLIQKGVPAEKVSVARHWIDVRVFTQVESDTRRAVRDRYGWGDQFVVLFGGNIGLVQGLDCVVDAAAALPDDSTRIVMVGDGTDLSRLQERVATLGLDRRVQFLGRQPPDLMPALFAGADALLVHLKKSELSRLVIPTKTMAYLASGRPIIMAMEGAAADLVSAAGAGIQVPSEHPDALVEAIETMRRMPESERAAMGARGAEYLSANFTRDTVIPEYEAILQASAVAGST